jgi:hypothetical protein
MRGFDGTRCWSDFVVLVFFALSHPTSLKTTLNTRH